MMRCTKGDKADTSRAGQKALRRAVKKIEWSLYDSFRSDWIHEVPPSALKYALEASPSGGSSAISTSSPKWSCFRSSTTRFVPMMKQGVEESMSGRPRGGRRRGHHIYYIPSIKKMGCSSLRQDALEKVRGEQSATALSLKTRRPRDGGLARALQ
jgi:hypothetical protein